VTVDILLGHSYFLALDPKQQHKMRPFPPLATLTVAAHLRARGHRVALFDAMLAPDEHHFEAALDRDPAPVVVLFEDNFNFLSKMCLARMRQAALAMVGMARRRGRTVVVAGSDVTDHPELYLASGADYAAVGEGDHTVAELVAWLGDGGGPPRRPDHIAGLAFAGAGPGTGAGAGPGGAGPVARTAPRANERHPDRFPHPARDLVDIDAYRRLWRRHHGRFTLNMVSTRGCPFHCNWCAKPIWGQRYAMRSAADVAAELATVKATIGPDHIWFADDIFGLRPGWLAAFAREVAARGAEVPFTIQSRCDLMTPEAVASLAAAGCHEVWLGAESGSQAVLDAMDKGITVAEIRTARARLGAAGIRAAFFVQFGYPGERWADIRATIELVRDTLPDDIGVSVSYPLPGTRFHALVADQLGPKANWDSSGDLDMMFRGTYRTPFYRRLHLALHDDLDLHRRKAGLPRVPHPSLPPLSRDAQEDRVARAWADVEALERSCRNRRPTLLARAEPAPAAPDLSRPFN
jgi:anaerobic magnesium-protoporphyrin IX monomethyl ester cyclase